METKAPLYLFGHPVDESMLLDKERNLLGAVTRWRSVRGPFGAVWVAKRDGVVHVKGHVRRSRRLSLQNLVTLLTWLTS